MASCSRRAPPGRCRAALERRRRRCAPRAPCPAALQLLRVAPTAPPGAGWHGCAPSPRAPSASISSSSLSIWDATVVERSACCDRRTWSSCRSCRCCWAVSVSWRSRCSSRRPCSSSAWASPPPTRALGLGLLQPLAAGSSSSISRWRDKMPWISDQPRGSLRCAREHVPLRADQHLPGGQSARCGKALRPDRCHVDPLEPVGKHCRHARIGAGDVARAADAPPAAARRGRRSLLEERHLARRRLVEPIGCRVASPPGRCRSGARAAPLPARPPSPARCVCPATGG